MHSLGLAFSYPRYFFSLGVYKHIMCKHFQIESTSSKCQAQPESCPARNSPRSIIVMPVKTNKSILLWSPQSRPLHPPGFPTSWESPRNTSHLTNPSPPSPSVGLGSPPWFQPRLRFAFSAKSHSPSKNMFPLTATHRYKPRNRKSFLKLIESCPSSTLIRHRGWTARSKARADL